MAKTTKHLLIVGLGNYTHPNTRHSVGMMIVDALAQRFNAPWVKRGAWQSEIATINTTLRIPKQKPPKAIPYPSAARRAVQMIADADAASTTATATNPSPSSTAESTSTTEPTSTTDAPSPVSPESTTIAKPKTKKSPEMISMDVTLTLLKPTLLMNVSGISVQMAVKGLGIPHSDLIVIHDDMERELGKVSYKTHGSHNGHNGIKSVIKSLSSQYFKRLRIGIGRPTAPSGNRDQDVVSKFVLGKFKPLEMKTLEEQVYDLARDEVLRMVVPSKSLNEVRGTTWST
ncbi:peptidyl-tRNA hydrolase, PTH1 family [Entomortierella parvispora]|uniref:peptidyl-tRNA hydrolase n=1 Tax=Entomortierella parvispora TaxID=205924 RepID=A0A9P3H501_9FUNG|nr:peptidyl-tRNA hydrolase, PTH1 family [Entomortierella parvispora]